MRSRGGSSKLCGILKRFSQIVTGWNRMGRHVLYAALFEAFSRERERPKTTCESQAATHSVTLSLCSGSERVNVSFRYETLSGGILTDSWPEELRGIFYFLSQRVKKRQSTCWDFRYLKIIGLRKKKEEWKGLQHILLLMRIFFCIHLPRESRKDHVLSLSLPSSAAVV